MFLIFRFPPLRKVRSHAFGKSSSWLNRAEYVICSERPAWSIQLISFDINCLLSVGLGPGKKLNFEWYKQIVLHGFQPLWLWAKACNLKNVCSSCIVDTLDPLVWFAELLSSALFDSWKRHVWDICRFNELIWFNNELEKVRIFLVY